MDTYIKKLQSKSEDKRKQILVGSLIVSMSLVVLVWVSTFGGSSTAVTVAPEESSDIKPFSLFTSSIGDAYRNISASVGNAFSKKKEIIQEEKQIDLIVVEHPEN